MQESEGKCSAVQCSKVVCSGLLCQLSVCSHGERRQPGLPGHSCQVGKIQNLLNYRLIEVSQAARRKNSSGTEIAWRTALVGASAGGTHTARGFIL